MERPSIFLSTTVQALRPSLRHRSRSALPRRVSRRRLVAEARTEDVYVGEGKVIQDDPRKYPSKEDAGPMQGATGGWAGGEPGLQRFIEQIDPAELPSVQEAAQNGDIPQQTGSGTDKIYVGFDYKKPEEVAAMRKGKQGRFIMDDDSKYPGRDFLGWLPLQGGFAGGEMGLQKFIEEGDIKIAGPEERGRSQMSPVLIGIFIAGVATTGGLLLTDAIDLGESLTTNVGRAQLDEKTQLLLEIAVGLLVSAWAGSAILAFFKAVRERLTSGASSLQKVLISVGFWVVVLVATYNLAKT